MTALADAAMGRLREAPSSPPPTPTGPPPWPPTCATSSPSSAFPRPVQRSVAASRARATCRRRRGRRRRPHDGVLGRARARVPVRRMRLRHPPRPRAAAAGFLGHARTLLTTKSWWDTVDALAANVVGPLVRAHPGLRHGDGRLDRRRRRSGWCAPPSSTSSMPRTAPTRRACSATAPAGPADREFFVRKAIGWALREYSKTDADAVRAFVATPPRAVATVGARGDEVAAAQGAGVTRPAWRSASTAWTRSPWRRSGRPPSATCRPRATATRT